MASELEISPGLKKHSVHEALLALRSLDIAEMHAMLHYVLVDLEARIEASSELSLDEFYIPFVAILINFSGGYSERMRPKFERIYRTTLGASKKKCGVLSSFAQKKQLGCVEDGANTSASQSSLCIRKVGESIMKSKIWACLQQEFNATADSTLTVVWGETEFKLALNLQSIAAEPTKSGIVAQVPDTSSDSSLPIGTAIVHGSSSKRPLEFDSESAEYTNCQSSKRQHVERGSMVSSIDFTQDGSSSRAVDGRTTKAPNVEHLNAGPSGAKIALATSHSDFSDEVGIPSIPMVEVTVPPRNVSQSAPPSKGSTEFRIAQALEGIRAYSSSCERGRLLYDELVDLDLGYSSISRARQMFLNFDRSILDIIRLVNMALWKRSKKFGFKKTFEMRDSITVIKLLESEPKARAPVLELDLKAMQRMGVHWSPCGLLRKGIAKTAVFPTFDDEEAEEEIVASVDEE